MVHIAADAFQDLLVEAHEEMAEELLLPIFEWSDFWPTQIASTILGLPPDDGCDVERLLEEFEAREAQEDAKSTM